MISSKQLSLVSTALFLLLTQFGCATVNAPVATTPEIDRTYFPPERVWVPDYTGFRPVFTPDEVKARDDLQNSPAKRRQCVELLKTDRWVDAHVALSSAFGPMRTLHAELQASSQYAGLRMSRSYPAETVNPADQAIAIEYWSGRLAP
jgi:hypothetical protein